MQNFPIEPYRAAVTITGMPGTGKSTAGLGLAERLGWEYYYTGKWLRELAKEEGIDHFEFYKRGTLADGASIDELLDNRQKMIGMEEDEFVLDGRIAFNFVKDSIKIYFYSDLDVASKRAYQDSLENPLRSRFDSVNHAKQDIQSRMKVESDRYMTLYGIDNHDHSNFNILMDVTDMTKDEVFDTYL
jgi:cytidylate kinase